MRLITISLLLFFTSKAMSYESKGLHKLNPFPLKDWVSRTYVRYQHVDIKMQRALEDSGTLSEYRTFVEEEIGKRVTKKSFFSLSINHESAKSSVLRSGLNSTDYHRTEGFSEPIFKFFSRSKWPSKHGDPVVDFFVSYSPKLGKRKVGGSNGNRLNGRHLLDIQINHGTFYEKWDFNIKFGYSFFSEGEEEDLGLDNNRDFESYSEACALFEFQHYLAEKYYLRGGVGILLIGDQKLTVDGSNTEIQQGTGSVLYAGLVRRSKTYSTLLKLERRRNDYFIRSSSNNIEGDYISTQYIIEFLKEF